MESLLSLSFDNISSRNTNKTSKGLRQIEGLLAQICLSPRSAPSSLASRQEPSATIVPSNHNHDAQQLQVLAEDLAFQEFFRLQNSFEWNVATRLTECLERLLGMRSTPQNDSLIRSTLALLQGALLLHPPSRTLFSRENHMSLLLDLLDPVNVSPETLAATLLVLITSLIDHPTNTRLFETLDGVSTVASLWKSESNGVAPSMGAKPVTATLCLELMNFYLMPEVPPVPTASAMNRTDMPPPSYLPAGSPHKRAPSKLSGGGVSLTSSSVKSDGSSASVASFSSSNSGSVGSVATVTRTPKEKRRLLSKYLDSDTERGLTDLEGFMGKGLTAC